MAYYKYILTCKRCLREFPSDTYVPHFCKTCKIETGKIQKYTSTFYRNRKIVFERDRNRCRCCKASKSNRERPLNVHHIDVNKLNNSLSNLITLCARCHMTLHRCFTISELRQSILEDLFSKVIQKSKEKDELYDKKFERYQKRVIIKPHLFRGIKK